MTCIMFCHEQTGSRNLKAWLPKVLQNFSWILSYILGHIYKNCSSFSFKLSTMVVWTFLQLWGNRVIMVNKFPGKFAHSFIKLSLKQPFPLGQTGSVFHVVCRCALKKTTALQSKCWQLITFGLKLKKPKSWILGVYRCKVSWDKPEQGVECHMGG